MADEVPEPVSLILEKVAAGDPEAAADLLPQVYGELRKLARDRLRHLPPGQTLQATALVHEAYLRVTGNRDPGWDGQGHFFAAAARAMRDILVEAARRRSANKRGGGRRRIDLDLAEPAVDPPSDDILAVDEAVKRLEEEDARKGAIVNLRYFARLTAAETGAALGISEATVRREWRYIRVWLERELMGED